MPMTLWTQRSNLTSELRLPQLPTNLCAYACMVRAYLATPEATLAFKVKSDLGLEISDSITYVTMSLWSLYPYSYSISYHLRLRCRYRTARRDSYQTKLIYLTNITTLNYHLFYCALIFRHYRIIPNFLMYFSPPV